MWWVVTMVITVIWGKVAVIAVFWAVMRHRELGDRRHFSFGTTLETSNALRGSTEDIRAQVGYGLTYREESRILQMPLFRVRLLAGRVVFTLGTF